MIAILINVYITDVVLDKKGLFKWTSKAFVKQEIGKIFPCEVDTNEITTMENRLRELGLYFDVSLQLEDSTKDTTRLIVRLTEGWYLLPSLTVNIDEETGWYYGGGLNIRHLFGWNYYVGIFYMFGGEKSYSLNAGKSWSRGSPFDLSLSIGKMEKRRVIENFNETDVFFNVNTGINIKKIIYPSIGLGYTSTSSDSSGKTVSLDNTDTYLSGNIGIKILTKEAGINPTRGFTMSILFKHYYGLQPVFAIERIKYSLTFYKTFENNTFATYFGYEGVFGRSIPAYLKLYLGSGSSIRGWGFGSLRGNHYINIREEVRVPLVSLKKRMFWHLKEQLTGLYFYTYYDIGFIGEEDFTDLLSFKYIDALGVGLNIFLPYIGGVRCELQRPSSIWKISATFGWVY